MLNKELELKFKLDLKKNLILFNPIITGLFCEKSENIKYDLELNLVKREKGDFNNNYINRIVFIFNKIIYINDFFFIRKYKLFDPKKNYNIFIKKQSKYLYFFRYNEIFKKFIIDVDKEKKYNSIFDLSLNNMKDQMVDVFEHFNYKINIFNLNLQINNLTGIVNFYEIIDTQNITNYIKYDIVLFPDQYFIYNTKKNMLNPIVSFIGLLCGLKYTNLGGVFILCIGTIYNKNNADIYLIGKKYFKESYLYKPEIVNPIKYDSSYYIFKDFQGIPEKDLKKLFNILDEIKKEYPDPNDLNIYDTEIREKYFIIKPFDKAKRYISGFLDTDLDDPEDLKLYEEIINFNNNFFFEKYKMVKKLETIMNIPEDELPDTPPSKEQINNCVLYCKKWNIEYNEYYDLPKQKKDIITNFLCEIYNNVSNVLFEFKEHNQVFDIKKNKLIKFQLGGSSINSTRKISLKKSIKNQNQDINQLIYKYNNKKFINSYNKYVKTNFENVNEEVLNLYANLNEELIIINNKLNQSILNIKSLYKPLYLEKKKRTGKFDALRYSLDYFKSNKKLNSSKKTRKTRKTSKKTSKKTKIIKINKNYILTDLNVNINKTLVDILSKKLNNNINLEWLVLYDMLNNIDIIPTECINNKKINIVHFSNLEMAESEESLIKMYLNKYNNFEINNNLEINNYFEINNHFQKEIILKSFDIENLKIKMDYKIDMFIYNIESNKFFNEKKSENEKNNDKIKIIFGILNGLLLLSNEGTLIVKLVLPIVDQIFINLIFICYNYFSSVNFYKPEQFFGDDYFYLVCKDFKLLSEEIKISIYEMIDFSSYKKNNEYIDNILTYDLINNYPKTFIYQFLFGYELIINKSLYRLEKEYFYLNNIKELGKEFDVLRIKYITEKHLEWLKNNQFYLKN